MSKVSHFIHYDDGHADREVEVIDDGLDKSYLHSHESSDAYDKFMSDMLRLKSIREKNASSSPDVNEDIAWLLSYIDKHTETLRR